MTAGPRARWGMTDIRSGDWVDRCTPASWRPYLRLARLDRPIGTWLLLFPGWWGVALAAKGWPDWRLMALFGIGAVAMRGAGCTLNDVADRDFDARVARTRTRPIASGAISVKQAIAFMAFELAIGAAVLLTFNRAAILLGFLVLFLIGTYPFMKRITYWPQFFLGLNFNWGALLGWAAVRGDLAWPAALLYIGGISWTLGYDTIYSHQDKEDDALIGVKSSALALGKRTRPFLFVFHVGAVALWAAAGALAADSWPFWLGLAVAAAQLFWQAATVDTDDSADCLAKFRSNRIVGWSLLLGIVAAHVV
ncbi:MAG: 4-hydroxybenzoate octaprenyltransferase [Alphaproteobacteria bacterium]|nr:4-hydroxybenzoate octaprenyltransferase [Alphaproteobacteria bacterium]